MWKAGELWRISYHELLVAESGAYFRSNDLQLSASERVTAALCFSRRFGQTFDRMLGFLKKPVVVTAEINMNLMALTVMGLISRLWGLSYPRAVV